MIPPAYFICVASPTFVDALTYEKKLRYFHIVDLHITINLRYIYLQFYMIYFNITQFLFMKGKVFC